MSVAGEAAAAAAAAAGAAYAVGALVWVRRRNGSWWPGRVMNPADAPPPTAIDSKNGTPVKLLGREDASVFITDTLLPPVPKPQKTTTPAIDQISASEAAMLGISGNSDFVPAYSSGSLLWVLRRNGYWWPGMVLSPDEAPPRTARTLKTETAVKLLGRENLDVEWFNLERSIRVKPFRCGEFDACIERVEASEDIPVKRREKYARREDAILHALEIERKQYKAGVITKKREKKNSSSVNHSKKSVAADCSKFGMHKSPLLSKRALTPVEEDNGVEEDIPETTPRTRGLQDFGLRIAPPKKKHIEFVAWDRLQKPVDNHADDVSCSGQNISSALSAAKRKNFSSHKRKTCMLDGSPAKRRDRRRPLHRVLESSDKLQSFRSFQSDHGVSVPPMQGEKDPMGTICRAKRSRCIYLPVISNDLSDHAGFSPKHLSTTHTTIGSSQHYCGPLADETTSPLSEAVDSESFERDYSESNMEEENNLLRGLENSGTHGRYNDSLELRHASSEVGVSKWHLKGKRNVRNIAKSCTKVMDGAVSSIVDRYNSSRDGTSYESKGIELNMRISDTSNRVLGHDVYPKKELHTGVELNSRIADTSNRFLGHDIYPKKELNTGDGGVFVDNTCDGGGVFVDNNCDGGVLVENDAHTQPIELGNQTHPSALRTANGCDGISEGSDDDSHETVQADWEVERPCHADKRAYWEEPEWSIRNGADYLSDEMEAMLVDVDLEVRASYQGEHVPLVSLMSRLNGKAIIGHPVQVEILDDGSSDLFFYPYEYSLDESTVGSPFWKTARTTAGQRDPRPNPASSALEGEDLEHLQGYYLESKPPLKKVYASHFSHQARLAKKSISHARRSASGKSQRKLIRNVSLSGQKIRTLSSLSTEQKCSIENDHAKQSRGNDILNGLIKSKGIGPLVTCVPAKVVFSRIVEAVGRPALSAPRIYSPAKDPSSA